MKRNSGAIDPVPAETSTRWADAFEAEIRNWRGTALSMGDGALEWGPRASAEFKKQKGHLAQLQSTIDAFDRELKRLRGEFGKAREAGDEAINAAFDADIREGAVKAGGSKHCADWWLDACSVFASSKAEEIVERSRYGKLTASERRELKQWRERADLAKAESLKQYREKKAEPSGRPLFQ